MAIDNKDKKVLNVPHLRFPEFTEEWERTTVGNIGNIKNGPFGSVLHAEDYVEDGIPIVTTEHFKTGLMPSDKFGIPQVSNEDYIRLKGFRLETNDIVFSRVGSVDINAHVGIEQNGWLFSGRVLRVRPKQTVDSLFLHYALSTEAVKRDICNRAVGQTMPSINTPILSSTIIRLPKGIFEQKKVAHFLRLLDERITTQNKIIEDLKKLKSAISERLFKGIEGSTVLLSDICDIVKGKQINGEYLSERGEYYVMNGGTEPSGYHSDYNVDANTISISEGGNSCGYVQFNTSPFWSGGHCYSIQNIADHVDNLYLYHYLKSNEDVIMKLRIGSGLPNIQKKDLAMFKIRVPAIEQQITISTFLSSLERKAEIEERILNVMQKQKLYLLQQMFI
ncbi:restriction endonuclease subunit S [uncultured Bacteroides sp.]|uniref:restriction endonuclease subunit S n=1 Tax=uncultured Bacteroides sp. TaxID=162156 RepID=UPI0025945FEE|nr:restriction endonuclease subunit S [uncultured Bacteroides sp.]